jgi:type VII secretion integral membrane protein EccD
VCIQLDHDDDPVAVDVALPSGTSIGELVPALVDLAHGRAAPPTTALHWHLTRPSGVALQETLSLRGNDVRDGELLILRPGGGPSLGPMPSAACQVAVAAQPEAFDVAGGFAAAWCVAAAVLASTVLGWTAGTGPAVPNLIIAVIGTCAAAAVAMVTQYATAATVAVVALSSATGFLVVPSAPAASNAFLAAMAASCASLVMQRLSGRVSPTLTASASFSALTAAATVLPMPAAATGAALATASLGLLALAPRVSVSAAALGPEHWSGPMEDRAARGHAVLTGLVVGGAIGAAGGAALVAVAAADATSTAPAGPVTLTAVTAVVLLLRARTYVDPARQIPLLAGGLVSIAACLLILFSACLQYVGWSCAVLLASGLVAAREPSIGAVASRLLDRVEYTALAAVPPVACWVGGVYAIVGGWRW